MDLEEIENQHDRALEILDAVMYSPDPEVRKDAKKLKEANAEAFKLEKACAIALDKSIQPSKAVLFKSAGWMAYDAEQFSDAIEMANEGLKDATHQEIIEELQELKKEAESKITNNG